MPDMDPHMQAAVYGTPQINPDERNHYLGTLCGADSRNVWTTSLHGDMGEAIQSSSRWHATVEWAPEHG